MILSRSQRPQRDESLGVFEDVEHRQEAGFFGMGLFLVSIGILFVTAILGYIYVRIDPDPTMPWPPPGMPPLPRIMILSTLVLLASSLTTHKAVRAARRNHAASVGGWMVSTLILAMLFLLMQAWAWIDVIDANMRISDHLYAWTFFILTGLHAVHMIAAIPSLLLVCVHALRRRYDAQRHAGLIYFSMYWHFLDGAWIALYLVLLWGS